MRGVVSLFIMTGLIAVAPDLPAAGRDDPPTESRIRADQAMAEIQLNTLIREYESLRVARVAHLQKIEFTRIEKDSYKTRSLRQRELEEQLTVLQDQLTYLDGMIEKARQELDAAVLKKAEAETTAPAP